MNQPIIRPAQSDDYDSVERLMKQVHALHVAWRPDIYQACDPVMSREEFDQLVQQESLIVAEGNGQIIAMLSWTLRHIASDKQVTRSVLFIDHLVVDEAHRGQGAGTQLLDCVRSIAQAKRCNGIELQVNARNIAALSMYKKYGFTEKSINMELL